MFLENDHGDRSFSFGRNWEQFVRQRMNAERLAIAQKRLTEFLEVDNLNGTYFIDVGSGSGLSSLAAYQSGAERVLSFDVDPRSVRATTLLRDEANKPENWEVRSGSILDESFVRSMEPGDLVYSWGVLHHTGNLWQSIRNAASLVRPHGRLFIGIYVATSASPYWTKIKQRYNRAGQVGKWLMETGYVIRHLVLPSLLHGRNPMGKIRDYKYNRGMDYMVDVRDWLGGYPYEPASIEDVIRFVQRQLGMTLINIRTGESVVEYLFQNTKSVG